MDFSQEDLFDACDRLVAGLLERAGVAAPPVDALRVAEDHLGIPVEWAEPEVDERGRPRPSSRRPAGGITLSPHMSAEQQQSAAAHGIARALLPDLLRKLDIEPGSESKQAAAHFRGLLAARVLVPTRMLRSALRACKYDLPALHRAFETAAMETVALRLLDLDSPCVISVVDDGVVAVRRGNATPVTKKLTPAEQACHDRVAELELPHATKAGGWTAHGWPVPNRRFKRVILRAVPDETDV
ncbi:MAG: ImmA/IrrE family metallo-endopeptidase [Gemmataceae bacterium]|nr:ImmA/IrrE family metallo-endopeptidase [Gemmataceae bacterium]